MLESLRLNGHYEDKSDQTLDVLTPLNLVESSSPVLENASLSDEALMAAYAQGNVQAFEKLYGRHKDPLLRYFLRQISSRATAEELFQETWQSLIKNCASYKSSAKFTTYLYTIAHSRLVDFYRKNGRAEFESIDNESSQQYAAEEMSQPEFQIGAAELKAQLLEALEAMPVAQKEVFLLKYEAGMSVPEIAKVLDDNPEAVKSRLRYCVANLKGFFNKDELVTS